MPVEGTGTTRQKLVPAAEGVINFASDGGVPAELFCGFCKRHLCSESWEFVVKAVQYEMVRPPGNCMGNAPALLKTFSHN